MIPRLAVVASHPIQYQAPLFRRIAANGRIDIEVLFLHPHGLEPSFDPGLGRLVRFDVPLTEGYEHRFLRNWSPQPSISTFTGVIQPGLVTALDPARVDAVLVLGYAQFSDWIAFGVARARGIPYLLRGETPDPAPEVRTTGRWLVKRALLGPVVRGAAGCLAIGRRNAAFYLSLGASLDRVRLAPYSVDEEAFVAGGREGRAERGRRLTDLGLDPDRPVVLFAGKLLPRKRVLDVIAACDRLGDAVSLIVIGDGEQREEVDELARHRPNLRVLGFVNQREIARWYGVADVFVLPSDRETWGLVVNEAMHAGAVPVVSDAVGCGPDLASDGAGRVYPVGDVSGLTAALDELLDPVVRAHAREEAARRIARYGIAETAAQIEETVLAL